MEKKLVNKCNKREVEGKRDFTSIREMRVEKRIGKTIFSICVNILSLWKLGSTPQIIHQMI